MYPDSAALDDDADESKDGADAESPSFLTTYTASSGEKVDDPLDRIINFCNVSYSTVYWYLSTFGIASLALVSLLFLLARFMTLLCELTLTWWTTREKIFSIEAPPPATYMTFFASFSAAAVVLGTVMALPPSRGAVNCAQRFHADLLHRVLRAPLRVFDVFPSGALMGFFSVSLVVIDIEIVNSINIALMQLFSILGFMALVGYGSPWLMLLCGGLVVALVPWMRVALPCARTALQLEDSHRSTATQVLLEFIGGASVLRASNRQTFFQENVFLVSLHRFFDLRHCSRLGFHWLWLPSGMIGCCCSCVTLLVLTAVYAAQNGVMHLRFSSNPTAPGQGAAIDTSARLNGLAGLVLSIGIAPVFGLMTIVMVSFMLDITAALDAWSSCGT
jgi:ABC-type multidrug transport system fused ATPase/permease subunit